MTYNTLDSFKDAIHAELDFYCQDYKLFKPSHFRFAKNLKKHIDATRSQEELRTLLFGAYQNLVKNTSSEKLTLIIGLVLAEQLDLDKNKIRSHEKNRMKPRHGDGTFSLEDPTGALAEKMATLIADPIAQEREYPGPRYRCYFVDTIGYGIMFDHRGLKLPKAAPSLLTPAHDEKIELISLPQAR